MLRNRDYGMGKKRDKCQKLYIIKSQKDDWDQPQP